MITDRQSLLAYGKDRPPQVRPLWLLMLLMSNPNVTGSLKLPLLRRITGWIATVVMFAVAVRMLATAVVARMVDEPEVQPRHIATH